MTTGRGRPKLTPAESARFIAVLREAVKRCGNQKLAAKALDLSPSGVSQLLSGKNGPTIATARKLKEITGMDFETPDVPPPPPVAPQPMRPRSQWQHLADPALEILIREGYAADESRRAIDSAAVFRSDREVTLEDLVKFARSTLMLARRESGKHRKHRSTK